MTFARALASTALLAAVVLVSAGGLGGQEKTEPPVDKKAAKGLPPGMPRYWEKLHLTDAQKEELHKLATEYRPKRQKLQEEMNKLDAELARKRVALLTDEQKRKLVDLVVDEPGKAKPAEKGKAGPAEKEKPKGKDPDK